MNEHMSDKDIFEMLSPKLEKNGIKHDGHITYGNNEAWNEFEYYTTETMQKIVALVYRVGYGRGVKGRPFDYANKEIKDEPVNKELRIGARVKMVEDYSKNCYYKEWYPSIGVYGTVKDIDGSMLRVGWDSETIKNNKYNNHSWWCDIKNVEVIR